MGQLRTGAASGVAAKYLAKPEARTLGDHRLRLAGGDPGCLHSRGAAGDRACGRHCRTEKSLRAFCKKIGAEPGESHQDAAEQDVVVTVTTSKDPVLRGEWLQPGALVCAVGANEPRARELDNVVLERAVFVCCDSSRAGAARVGRPDRAGPARRPRLARGARAPGSRRGRACRAGVPRRHRRLQVKRPSRVGCSNRPRSPREGSREESRTRALKRSRRPHQAAAGAGLCPAGGPLPPRLKHNRSQAAHYTVADQSGCKEGAHGGTVP